MALEDEGSFKLLQKEGVLFIELATDGKKSLRVCVDFLSKDLDYRRSQGMGKKQLFAKALGLNHQVETALDLTAGFGVDAFVMSCYGLKVTSLERDPVLFKLLDNGRERALKDPDLASQIEDKLQFVAAEAFEFLKQQADKSVDLVFFDPMYPEKKKSALAKKEMQVLQKILPAPCEQEQRNILAEAFRVARKRVVVKRPPKAPPIRQRPSLSFSGKAVRYDIYLSPR